tara:strand:- start:1079 stop:1912 length:834 start_codon:yes stop_codon:yes gene_type:complete
MKKNLLLKKFFIYIFAFIVFLIMFFPLYGLILTSIQPENIIRSRNLSFFPKEIIFSHFAEVLKPDHISNLYVGMKNSLIISILTSFLCLILGFPAAYSLSRLNLPAKNIILGSLISIYFLPTILFVIPLFVILVSYQLDDTILSLAVPYTAFILPFVIWILKSFIDKLPIEVEEAAKIDGCSTFQILFYIIFPLLRPGIIAAFIFAFILSWVEFLTPLIFTNNLKISTVALGLFRSTIDIKIGQQAAAAIITLIPVTILMIFFQQYITKVVLTGSNK